MKIKNRTASNLGSVLEWYDFALYGFFAPLLAQLYFPDSSVNVRLLKIFSIGAIGFFARPFGALIFGHISDKYGRTTSLKITPLLITVPTTLLCFLPTYKQIGITAPFLMIILRTWQGICIGGEYANNIVYLCEETQVKNRYFMGSLGSCASSLGILLASLIATISYAIFTPENLEFWGWRIAFGISIILGLITHLMRKKLEETSVFISLKQKKRLISNPIIFSFKNQWQDCLLTLCLAYFPATAFYYVFIFLPNHLINIRSDHSSEILSNNSVSLLMRLFIIPILGIIADRVGGIKLSRLSCILFLFFSFPSFYCILHCPYLAKAAIYLFAFLTTLNAASTPGLLIELLDPKTRSTILAFGLNVAFGIFGGITPVLCFFLIETNNNPISSVFYLIFTTLITFTATFFFKAKKSYYET